MIYDTWGRVYGEIILDVILIFPKDPIAQSTILGWILSGPCVNTVKNNSRSTHSLLTVNSLHVATNDALSYSLTRFWEI